MPNSVADEMTALLIRPKGSVRVVVLTKIRLEEFLHLMWRDLSVVRTTDWALYKATYPVDHWEVHQNEQAEAYQLRRSN